MNRQEQRQVELAGARLKARSVVAHIPASAWAEMAQELKERSEIFQKSEARFKEAKAELLAAHNQSELWWRDHLQEHALIRMPEGPSMDVGCEVVSNVMNMANETYRADFTWTKIQMRSLGPDRLVSFIQNAAKRIVQQFLHEHPEGASYASVGDRKDAG